MSKYKVLALMGESASGKSTLADLLARSYPSHFSKIITCTTRPPRQGEVNGVDYHFISPELFAQKVCNYTMLEATCFNGWHYGTSEDALKKDIINLGVFNPSGIRALQDIVDIDLLTFYLQVPARERIIRSLLREDTPNIDEIFRRYKADLNDFFDIDDINYFTFDFKPGYLAIYDYMDIIRGEIEAKWKIKI